MLHKTTESRRSPSIQIILFFFDCTNRLQNSENAPTNLAEPPTSLQEDYYFNNFSIKYQMCSRNGHERDGRIKKNDEQHQNGGKDKSRSSSSSKDQAANGKRIRDQDGYRQRAAAFCARLIVPDEYAKEEKDGTTILGMQKETSKLEVLMVSGRREGSCENYWVLPGGGVENLESTEEAVVRELREEAGILGRVLFLIGKFIDEQRFHHTTLYFLTVQKTFDVWENCENGRERRWMGMDEAKRSIKTNQLAMLEQSIGIIERTIFDHSKGTLNHPLPSLENNADDNRGASCPSSVFENVTIFSQFLPVKSSKACMAKSASLD